MFIQFNGENYQRTKATRSVRALRADGRSRGTSGRTEPLQRKCNSDFGRHFWDATTSDTGDDRRAARNKRLQLDARAGVGGPFDCRGCTAETER